MVTLNRRISVVIVGSSKNDIGGPVAVDIDSWDKWAQVDNRSGGNSNPHQQQVWQYDYKITMRYEKTRPTQSNYQIIYEGMRLKIESVTIDAEGYKAQEICRCSKIDQAVTVNQSS